jgi:hypothetical protein
MPGVPRELVEHALNVDPKAKPVKQPLQRFDEPKRKAIASELHRLESAGFIREIKTSSWVSNPVIVPKKNTDVQRVCVDYTSLNKHCPKDPFPLPRTDQIIDSTTGCVRLSFLDAYSGYNQIKLKKEDKEKTAFITPYGVFCYQVMPFGLKNAGATYQVVSTVLVVKRSEEGKAHSVQRPVYFISEVLSPTKQRYPHFQKLAYSVFTTARKLRQYFVVHPIIVVNEAPLSNILNNPSATGRVSLWGIELSPMDIMYEKRKAIKSQVLPDFTAEWLELQSTGPPDLSSVWTMYFDGSTRV